MASPDNRKSKRRVRVKSSAANSPEIGEITHYFANIKVAVVKVTGQGLRLGDKINIKGKATDLLQKVESMQIESVDVKAAKKGESGGAWQAPGSVGRDDLPLLVRCDGGGGIPGQCNLAGESELPGLVGKQPDESLASAATGCLANVGIPVESESSGAAGKVSGHQAHRGAG